MLPSSRNAWLAAYLYLPLIKKVVSVENDVESCHSPYVFLLTRMVHSCSASFVKDNPSLIEITGMQQKRNNNKKYTIKFFFNSAGLKEETSVAVFCCLFDWL